MVVNFRARMISRGTRKLTRTPTLIKKKNIEQPDKKKNLNRSLFFARFNVF
jgi:hypothetical protein